MNMNSIAKSITLILMLILPSFGFSQRNGSKIMDFRNIDYRLLDSLIIVEENKLRDFIAY